MKTVSADGAAAARPAGAVTADGAPAMVLRSPYLGDETAQAVLYTDESGTTRWIFQSPQTQDKTAARGDGAPVEFLLPLESEPLPPKADAEPGTRGPFTKFGRRLVRVLAWATGDLIGKGALYAAERWENTHHPYQLRRFPFDDPAPPAWDELAKGPALLLHGTFSTAPGAFVQLSPEATAALRTIYGNRIFAFNHPSLYHSPSDNVKQLFTLLPANANLDVDIVTHSRGGLVGRELTERAAGFDTQGKSLRVHRAIFVASPHRGTILTDSDHGITMLDRYTNE